MILAQLAHIDTYQIIFGDLSWFCFPKSSFGPTQSDIGLTQRWSALFRTNTRNSVDSGELVAPCDCKGSSQFVHLACLRQWQKSVLLTQSTHPRYQTRIDEICNVCEQPFKEQFIAPYSNLYNTIYITWIDCLIGFLTQIIKLDWNWQQPN